MSEFQPLTSDEKKLYSKYFKLLDVGKSHSITGEAASQFFEKSLLDPQILFQIWELADSDSKGYLNQLDFIKALRLIGNVQANPSATVNASLYNTPAPPPVFQGVSLLPNETSGSSIQVSNTGSLSINNTGPIVNLPPINPSEIVKFSSLFQRHASAAKSNGLITGQEASGIFLRAKLPESTLGLIWELADRSHIGSLTKVEFCLAMYLIQLFLRGVLTQVPPTVPDSIWRQIAQALSAAGPSSSKPISGNMSQQTTGQLFNTTPAPVSAPTSSVSNWTVTKEQVNQYNSLFQSLDKQQLGMLTSQQVAPFLLSSNLKQEDLATIWDLADLHKSGEFTPLEFSICMFLVAKRLKDEKEPLPATVPTELIQSIKAFSSSAPAPGISPPPKVAPTSGLQLNNTNSSINDLVDIFGSSQPPAPPSVPAAVSQQGVQRSSSMSMMSSNNFTGSSLNSNGTGSGISAPSPPSANTNDLSRSYTGSTSQLKKFKPSSNFGQNMMIAEEPAAELQQQQSAPASSAPPTIPAPRHSTIGIPSAGSSAINFSNPVAEKELSSLNDQIDKHQISIANTHTQTKSLEQQQRDLDLKLEQTRQKLEAILESKKTSESKFSMFKKTHDSKTEQLVNLQKMYDLNFKNYDSIRNEVSILQAQCNEKDGAISKLTADMDALSQQQTSLQSEKKNLRSRLADVNSHNENLNQRYQDLFKMIQDQTNFNNIQKKQLDVLSTKNMGVESQIDEKEKELESLKAQNSKDLQQQELLESQLKEKEAKLAHLKSQVLDEKSKNKDISIANAEISRKLESTSASSGAGLVGVAASAAIGGAAIGTAVNGNPFSKPTGTEGTVNQKEVLTEPEQQKDVEFPSQHEEKPIATEAQDITTEKEVSTEKPSNSSTGYTSSSSSTSSSDDEDGIEKDIVKNIDDDDYLDDFVVPTRAPVAPPVAATTSKTTEASSEEEEAIVAAKDTPLSPPTGTMEDIVSSGNESSSDDDDLEGPEDVDKRYYSREMLSEAKTDKEIAPKSEKFSSNINEAANSAEDSVYDNEHKPYLSRSAVDAAAAEATTSNSSNIPGSFNPATDFSSASVAGSSVAVGSVSPDNAAANIDSLTLNTSDAEKANSVMSQVNPDTWFDDDDAVFVSPSVSENNARPSMSAFRSVSIDSSASDVFTDAQEEINSPGYNANGNSAKLGQFLNSNANNVISPSDIHAPTLDEFDSAFHGLNPATTATDFDSNNNNEGELEFLDNATVRPTADLDSEFHFSEMTPATNVNAGSQMDDEFTGMKQAIDHEDLDDEFDDGFNDELEGFTGANESNLSSQEKQFKKNQDDDFDAAFNGMSSANHADDDFDSAFNGMSTANNDEHFEEDEFAEFSNNNNKQITSNDNDEFDSAFNI